MTGPDDRDKPYFVKARVIAGLGCFAIAGLLAVLDVFSTDFELSPVELGLFLGTAALLLGVEGVRRLMG